MEPASYEVVDGQYTMKFQETLFHFLDPVYIYFFYPLFVHYHVPVIQTNITLSAHAVHGWRIMCQIDIISNECTMLLCEPLVANIFETGLRGRCMQHRYAVSEARYTRHSTLQRVLVGTNRHAIQVGSMDSAETAVRKGQFCAGVCKDTEHDAAYLHFWYT